GTTLLIAAPSWRLPAPLSGERKLMQGHARVHISTPDGKPLHASAVVTYMGWNNEVDNVEAAIVNDKVDVDLGSHANYFRAALVVFTPGYGTSFL
ncbi:hypothetical protein ABTN45_18995, partial [Acinetobacter baumannii]